MAQETGRGKKKDIFLNSWQTQIPLALIVTTNKAVTIGSRQVRQH